MSEPGSGEWRPSEPTLLDLVRELRVALGLFNGAMPITPEEAWREAIANVRTLIARQRGEPGSGEARPDVYDLAWLRDRVTALERVYEAARLWVAACDYAENTGDCYKGRWPWQYGDDLAAAVAALSGTPERGDA